MSDIQQPLSLSAMHRTRALRLIQAGCAPDVENRFPNILPFAGTAVAAPVASARQELPIPLDPLIGPSEKVGGCSSVDFERG